MTRLLLLSVGALLFASCLTVTDAREGAANRACQWEDKCGNVGSGKNYANPAECMTDKRSDFQSAWPTDRCDGRIDGASLDTCFKAIDNTRCNDLFDAINTASKCSASSVCSASNGSSSGCNCTNGQTCCSNACTNLQTDRNNCGGCGTTCGAGLSCVSGQCK